MEIINLLKKLNFSEKEAIIYLTCLQLSEDTAFNIAKKANLKRPTVYIILENLKEKGFISIKKTKKATLFNAANPKKLLTILKNKTQELEKNLPKLSAIYNQQPKKPEIQFFQGKESIIDIYTEVFQKIEKGIEVIFYGSIKEPISQFPELYKKFIKLAKNKKSKIKELLPQDERNLKYYNLTKKFNNPNHKTKFFNKKTELGNGDNIIYDNKIAFLPYHKNEYYIITIENIELVKTHKTLFNHVWQKAKKLT